MQDDETKSNGNAASSNYDNRLVRLIKSIVVNPDHGTFIDERIIKPRYYNAFNFSFFSREHEDVNLTVGIISARQGEGKTLVASNLAVSLAVSSQKKTILVDLNFIQPRIHEIFGTAQSPGLAEALNNGEIYVSGTSLDQLSVLTTGNFHFRQEGQLPSASFSNLATHTVVKPSLGLHQLAEFRDVIYSLKQQFEFVIVDLPSMDSESVPTLFANQLGGLIVVVNSGKTKLEDIDPIFQQFNERQILGFVFNRFKK